MSHKPSLLAFLAVALVTAPAFAGPPKKLSPKEQAAKDAADKAAADQAAKDAADKAAADQAAKDAADKAAADQAAKDAADKDTTDKAAADKAATDKAGADDKYDAYEDPSKPYRFIGLRFRDVVVPKFMINAFGVAGGTNVNVPMVGPEFISRHDHLEYAVAIMYAPYTMAPTIFRNKKDPQTSNELVQSDIKLLYAMVDILYEVPIDKDETKPGKTGHFAFLVGGGLGFAGVFGPLYRSKAYPINPSAANDDIPSQWAPCTGVGKGRSGKAVGNGFCQGAHFSPSGSLTASDSYQEPYWGSGSKPAIFPWLALPEIGFRYKPVKQFQAKVDFGFSTSGFFGGLSASYGL